MRKIYHTVPYSTYTGQSFDAENLIESLLECKDPFNRDLIIEFDENRKLHSQPFKGIEATVTNPPSDFARRFIEAYMSGHKFRHLIHESKYHRATVLDDGQMQLTFLVDGEAPEDVGGVYTAILKNPDQVEYMTKQWTAVARKLGFGSHPVQTISLKNGCEAVKICTEFRKIGKNEITPYINDTLLNALEDPESKLLIKSTTSSLIVDSESMTMRIKQPVPKKELSFAVDILRDGITKEPKVTTIEQVETFRDSLSYHKEFIAAIGVLSFPPASSALLGYVLSGGTLDGAVLGAGIGGLLDGLALGVSMLQDAWRERKYIIEEEKSKARRKFAELALKLPHLKEPYGACVVVSTEKCVMKAAKEEQE